MCLKFKLIALKLNIFNKPLDSCYTESVTSYFRNSFCKIVFQDVRTQRVFELFIQRLSDNSAASRNNFMMFILQWKLSGWHAGKAPFIRLEAAPIKSLQSISLAVL
ncbi:MAG: hypothetical protein ACJAT9_000522 [Polaribacter sp.]|jgi:uncharacterized protein (DUF2237 family)|tara:strand:+ start:2304 stop:2621 length:318 start_codon:yes stop_codon:yes gene_type:complete